MKPPAPLPPPVAPKYSTGPNVPPGSRPITFADEPPPIVGTGRAVLVDAMIFAYAAQLRTDWTVDNLDERLVVETITDDVVETLGAIVDSIRVGLDAIQVARAERNGTTNQNTTEGKTLWNK